MRIEKKDKIIEIKEEVTIEQDNKKIILEKGDKIRVLERDVSTYKAPKGKSWDDVVKELERQGAKSGKDYDLIGSENFWVSYKFDSPELQNILKKTSKESKMKEIIEIKKDISLKQDDKKIILEKGDKIRILEDEKFNYMMLDRLRQDCTYAINQSKSTRQLWGKTVDAHIAEMRRLYRLVKEKPEWLSLEDINMYEKELKKLEKSGK